jgi:predicted short-subunit dehydrogenase-like oxidoreductase (DUF2520 family)
MWVGRDLGEAWTSRRVRHTAPLHKRRLEAVWYLVRELERDMSHTAGPSADHREHRRVRAGAEPLPRLAVIGRGRVGGAIARAGAAAGVDLEAAGRDDALRVAAGAEAALLCVPDDAIADACATIAGAVPPLRFIGHVSGATKLDALSAATERGAQAFSLHPLQTVPDGATDLTGAPCAIAGSSAEAVELARALAEHLGMRPFEVPEEHRAAYHAAASVASNFLVALQESAADLLSATGVEDARELLAPLVLRTAANWSERGGDALTGPIARGDTETVRSHLTALDELAPELVPLYEALAERTRAVGGSR